MGNLIGLLLYLIVFIIGNLIKNRAEEKTRRRYLAEAEEPSPEVVQFEEIEGDLIQTVEGDFVTISALEIEEEEIETDWPDKIWEPEQPASKKSVSHRKGFKSSTDLTTAIVMSEIIRMPRAKRPWPIR